MNRTLTRGARPVAVGTLALGLAFAATTPSHAAPVRDNQTQIVRSAAYAPQDAVRQAKLKAKFKLKGDKIKGRTLTVNIKFTTPKSKVYVDRKGRLIFARNSKTLGGIGRYLPMYS